jgi:hypothetical protein
MRYPHFRYPLAEFEQFARLPLVIGVAFQIADHGSRFTRFVLYGDAMGGEGYSHTLSGGFFESGYAVIFYVGFFPVRRLQSR